MNLKNAAGKTVSHNTYWMAPNNDYKLLNAMSNAVLSTKVIKVEKGLSENKYTLQITNNGSQIAFFINPQLMLGAEEVMPSYWSANYFSLAGKESMTVSVGVPVAKLNGGVPVVSVGGWNVKKEEVSLVAVK